MTPPLILQLQQALLDNSASLSEALRKAKVVCFKLELREFEAWVNSELDGYMHKSSEEVPKYRKLHGIPEAFSPYQGWMPIHFQTSQQQDSWSLAVIGMTVPAIEELLRSASASPGGVFGFPYPAEVQNAICQTLNWGDSPLRIRLDSSQVANILHAVRDNILNWTLEMEKQGILGSDLVFSEEDRRKSTQLTESVVTHIHIGSVGSFVQSATNSVVQGEVNTASTLAKGVHDLVQQIAQSLPTANLPAQVAEDTRKALDELREAENGDKPDSGRLRMGLEMLKRVVAPAGEHILKLGIDAVVTKLLGS